MRSSFVSAAALLAAAPAALASKAYVHNQCTFPVYIWSVDSDSAPGASQQIAAGGEYSEECRRPNVGGVSIKIHQEDNLNAQLAQFEYTVGGAMEGHLWYDLSFVDCQDDSCPWKKYAMYMNSEEGCPTVKCDAGVVCAGAYNLWNDDWASRSCPEGADIHLWLCTDHAGGSAVGGGSSESSSSSSTPAEPSSSSSSAESSAAAVPSFQPAVKAPEVSVNAAPVAPTTTAPPVVEHVATVVETVTVTSTTTQEYQFPGRHAARHINHRRHAH